MKPPGAGAADPFSTGFCPKPKPGAVEGWPKENGVAGLSVGLGSALGAKGLAAGALVPKEKGVELAAVGWPNGEDVDAVEPRLKPPFSLGASGFPFSSIAVLLVGLSSIMITESSFLGGVTVPSLLVPLVAAEVPNNVEPDDGAAAARPAVGAPKTNAFASVVGVDGACPNVNGDLAGSGAGDVDGVPKVNGEAPPKSGLGASTTGGDVDGVVGATLELGAAGWPNVNGDLAGSTALGLGVADPKRDG